MAGSGLHTITDTAFTLPSWEQLVQVLTFQAGYNTAVVVSGATLLGIAAGTIGTFALLRKRSLMGDALAHATLPGLAAAFLIAASLGFEAKNLSILLIGATCSGVLGILTVQAIVRFSRLHQDTAIGVVLSCFFGAGIVLLSVIQNYGSGQEGGLHHFIFGQTASMSRSDAYFIFGVALVAFVACLALLKEFRLVCFDEGFANSDGWPVTFIDLLIMSLVVLVTVLGLQAVGLLLVIALLIIPPAAARFWTERLYAMTIIAGIIGGASGFLGASASSLLPRLPAGAVIVLVSGVLFLLSVLVAPERGILSSLLSSLRLKLRISREHLLREVFEVIETQGTQPSSPEASIPLRDLKILRALFPAWRALFLMLLSYQGLISVSGQTIRLTPEGALLAAEKVRNHRLWEEYLMTHSDLPPSHIDYSADMVEHFLSPEILTQIEESLEESGKLVEKEKVPESIHSLDESTGEPA